jgi:signal transduction histidine kinase
MKNPLFSLILIFVFNLFAINSYCQDYTNKEITQKEKIVNITTDQKIKINTLFELVNYYQANNVTTATNYRKSLEKLVDSTSSRRMELDILIVKETLLKEDFDATIKQIIALKQELQKKYNEDIFLDLTYLEAQYYNKQRDFEKSKKIVEQVLKKYKNSRKILIADFYLLKGSILQQESKIEASMADIEKAKKICAINKNVARLNKCRILTAYNYLFSKNFEKALITANEALQSNTTKKSNYDLMREELAIGTVYFFLAQYDMSKKHLTAAIKLNKKGNFNYEEFNSVAMRYINLADYELGNYDAVIQYCINQLKSVKKQYTKYALHYQLAVTYNKTKNFIEAKKQLGLMENILYSNKNFTNIDHIEYFTEAAITEAGLGNYKIAYEYSQKYNEKYSAITDSINAKQTIENQARFELNEKELKLKGSKIKEQKALLNLVESKKEKNILIFFLLFLLFLGFVNIFFARRVYYKNKKLAFQQKIIQEKNETIEKSNKTIKKTFTIISHDLRDPFNAILGFTGYILDNFKEIEPEDLKKQISSIHNAANKNYELTQQLLHWSLKQQDGFVLQTQNYLLSDIIKTTIENLDFLANQKNIKIIFENPKEITYCLDANIISNAMHNIITNAIKFSNQNESIIIHVTKENNNLTITIKDTGKGMTEEQLQELNSNTNYETFNYLKSNGHYNGGFGLLYSKELIAMHKGKLHFDSKINEGTTVSLVL